MYEYLEKYNIKLWNGKLFPFSLFVFFFFLFLNKTQSKNKPKKITSTFLFWFVFIFLEQYVQNSLFKERWDERVRTVTYTGDQNIFYTVFIIRLTSPPVIWTPNRKYNKRKCMSRSGWCNISISFWSHHFGHRYNIYLFATVTKQNSIQV